MEFKQRGAVDVILLIKLMETNIEEFVFANFLENVIEVKIDTQCTSPLIFSEEDCEFIYDNENKDEIEGDEILRIFVDRSIVNSPEELQKSRNDLEENLKNFEFGSISKYLYKDIEYNDFIQKSKLLYRLELDGCYSIEELDLISAIILDILIELFVEQVKDFDLKKQTGKFIEGSIQEEIFLNAAELIKIVKFLDDYEYKFFGNINNTKNKGKDKEEKTHLDIKKTIEKIEINYDVINNKFKVPRHLTSVYTYCLLLNSNWLDTNVKILNKKTLNLKNTKNKYAKDEVSKKYYSTLFNNFRVFCESLLDVPIYENNVSANVYLFNMESKLFDIFLFMNASFHPSTGKFNDYKKHYKKAEKERFIEILKIPGMLNMKRIIYHSKYRRFFEDPLHIEYLIKLISLIKSSIERALKTKFKENYEVEIIKLFNVVDPYKLWIEEIYKDEWFNFDDEKKENFAIFFSLYCKVVYGKISKYKKETE